MDEPKNEVSHTSCKHCGWIGKHLLQHLRHSKICKQMEDVNELRRQNEEKRKTRKRKYCKAYDLERKEKKKQYYQENKKIKIDYQQDYDVKNKEKRKVYNEKNKDKQKSYQKKYYQENKGNRQIRKKFMKCYVRSKETTNHWCCPTTFSFRRNALEAFLTPAAKHMFEHSVGQGYCCEGNNYIIDWNGEDFRECSSIWKKNYIELIPPFQKEPTLSNRTITAHQIDHDVKNETCLQCGNKLIKLCNVNRLQCHICYAAKCFICKSNVDPDIYKAYKHFWVKNFNNFVPGLCSYFENSEKADKLLNDTCASCE